MTHTEIENMFDRMRLPYNPVKKSRFRSINGYWTIPGENYEFRTVAILPRNNWGIEVTRLADQLGREHAPRYILPGEAGIFFIQRIICDQIDLRHLLRKNQWELNQTLLGHYMHKRMDYLLLHQLKRA